MSRIVVDELVQRQLAEAHALVEVYGHSGQILGHFLPANRGFFVLPSDQCPYTAEELAAMRAEEGGTSLAELWQELGRSA